MHVNRIVEDDWIGVRSNHLEYECTSVEQVVAAIRKLNGQNKTTVVLQSSKNTSLTVSGGTEGRYCAFVTVGVDDAFYILVDPQQPEGVEYELVTGGQHVLLAARNCIDLETVLTAASQFALDGSLSPLSTWEKDPP